MKQVRIYINGTSQYAPMIVEEYEIEAIREKYERYGHKVVVLEKEGGSGVPPPPMTFKEKK